MTTPFLESILPQKHDKTLCKIKWLIEGDKTELSFIFKFYTEIPLQLLCAKRAARYGKWRVQRRPQLKIHISSTAHSSMSG